MIKCTECGYENMDGLDYCDGCGAKLNPEAASAAPEAPAAEAAADGGAQAPQEPAAEAAQSAAAGAPEAATAPEAAAPEAATAPEEPTGELHPAQPAVPPAAEPAAAPSFKAKLIIVRGGRQGHEFELQAGNNLVGRWDPDTGAFPEVDLEADDPEAKISRKHALIRIDGDQITVEDIGSLNGTYVNRGTRLAPGNPVALKNNDEIIVGKTFFRVSVEPVS